MSLQSRFFALTYDRQLAKVERAGLRELRERLLTDASGRVLEIGAGTGANLAFYGASVESLTITEPEKPMLRRLQRRVGERSPQPLVLRAPAEDLPFEDDTFDTAVSTLVLCALATSRVRSASCGACCIRRAGSSSSSTYGPTNHGSRACKTA